MAKAKTSLEAIPEMRLDTKKKDGQHVAFVFEVNRPTVTLYTTPKKKTKTTAEKMAAKWIEARTKQLTRIDELKRERQKNLAAELAEIYRQIDEKEAERKALGASIKGLEGELKEKVRAANAPEVELQFSFVDAEAKKKKAKKGSKPKAKSPAGKAKKATKKGPRKTAKKKGRR